MNTTSSQWNQNRWLILLGHLFFLFQFILAFVFFKERMLLLDPAYISYSIIENEGFAIQVYRLGAILTQWVPLSSYLLGFDLKWILLHYSLTFPVFYWLIFLLLVYYFKEVKLGLILYLGFAWMSLSNFYWIVAEFHQGMAVSLIWLAFLLENLKKSKLNSISFLILFSIFTAFVLTFHPLMLIVLSFYLIWANLTKRLYWKQTINLFVILVLLFLFKTFYFHNLYEDSKLSYAQAALIDFFTEGKTGNLPRFFKNCLLDHYFFLTFWILGITYHLKKKEWPKAVLYAYIMGFVFLIALSYPKDSPKLYMDALYFSCGFLLLLCLIDEFKTTRFRSYSLVLWATLFILVVRMPLIWAEHHKYTDRLLWVETIVKKMRGIESTDRFFVDRSEIPLDLLVFDWALFYETILSSSLDKSKETRVATVVPNPHIENWRIAMKIAAESGPQWYHDHWGSKGNRNPFCNRFCQIKKGKYTRLHLK